MQAAMSLGDNGKNTIRICCMASSVFASMPSGRKLQTRVIIRRLQTEHFSKQSNGQNRVQIGVLSQSTPAF